MTNDAWKNFEPRKNAPGIAPKPETIAAPVDYMDDAACRKLCREELVIAIKANSGKAVVANLVNALLDRIDGKAPQASELTINASVQTTTVLGMSEAQQIELLEDMADRLRRKRAPTIDAIPYVVQEAVKDDGE